MYIKVSVIKKKKRFAFCPFLKWLLRIKKHKKSIPQICTISKVLKGESEFNQIKRNNEMRLAKSCRECSLKKYEEKKKALELEYQHLWIREDGSKITDPWEIVDDHKDHTCDVCTKEQSMKEFVIYGSKYNPK